MGPMPDQDPTPIMDDKHEVNVDEAENANGLHGGHAVGNALLVGVDGHVRKIPVPSSDPNDPLNFLPWQKYGVVVCCCWFSIMSLSLSGGLGAILSTFFGLYMPQGHSAEQIVYLLTFPSLFIGIGNFLVLPMTLWLGRRPTFLIANIVLLIATIGAAVSSSYEGHLIARVFQGLTTGATESLLPLMLSEVTFIHERATVYGWYWATQTILSSVLNIASSYETINLSWRWYYGIYVITIGVGLIMAFFLAFETRFHRGASVVDGEVMFTDEFGTTRVLSGDEAREHNIDSEAHQGHNLGIDIPRNTYRQLINPWSGTTPNGRRVVVRAYISMVEAFTSPGLVYALLIATIVLGCAIGVSLTYDTVLQDNYGWPAENIGLINLGPVPSSIAAMIYAGYLGDKFTLWMAARNKGVHTPEHRLPLLIVPGIIGFGGLLLYGFTASNAHHRYSWWAPVMGWTLLEFTFVSTLILSTTFAAEAWPKNPGPALVVVIGAKNIISFGVTYGLTPMIAKHGYEWSCGVLAGIMAGILLLGIPVYFLNPKWRKVVAEIDAKKLRERSRAQENVPVSQHVLDGVDSDTRYYRRQ